MSSIERLQASLVAQLLKNLPAMQETLVQFLGQEDPLEKYSLVGQMVKNPPALRSVPGLGRSPGGGHGNPLHYPCLENPMDRRGWQD